MTNTVTRAMARFTLPVVRRTNRRRRARIGRRGQGAHAIDAHRPSHSASMVAPVAHHTVVIKKAVVQDFDTAFLAGHPAPERQRVT